MPFDKIANNIHIAHCINVVHDKTQHNLTSTKTQEPTRMRVQFILVLQMLVCCFTSQQHLRSYQDGAANVMPIFYNVVPVIKHMTIALSASDTTVLPASQHYQRTPILHCLHRGIISVRQYCIACLTVLSVHANIASPVPQQYYGMPILYCLPPSGFALN